MTPVINITPEDRAKRWVLAGKIVGLFLIGLIVAPVVASAVVGLTGLLISIAIIVFGYFALPVFGMLASNLALLGIKYLAWRNPIETLQNESLRLRRLLAIKRKDINTFDAQIRTFEDKLEGFKREYPEEAPKFQAQLEAMKKLLSLRQQKYKEAIVAADKFDLAIDKSRAIWDMAKEATKLDRAAGSSRDEFYAKIKTETAMDSIQMTVNTAFAELDTLSWRAAWPDALPNRVAKQLTIESKSEKISA